MPSRARKKKEPPRGARQPEANLKRGRTGPTPSQEAAAAAASPERRARLGTKHLCFACQTKFYDMNRPEPVCPKCGADQRARPVEAVPPIPPPQPPVRRPIERPMAPLLDEDEEVVRYEEDVDLGLGPIEEEEDLFPKTDQTDDEPDDEEFES